MIYSTIF